MQNRLIFIGGGKMAEAIFSHLENSKILIIVVQRNPEKSQILQQKYNHYIQVKKSLNFIINSNDLVILAMKPQDAKEFCKTEAKKLKNSIIISIMAGIDCLSLSNWISAKNIVRVMPNTPSAIGYGVTGIYFMPEIEIKIQKIIKNIFTMVGKVYCFTDENYIDKITAIAGSAPAYVFYLIESMIDSAISQFNFNEKDAKEITLQVFRGALAMIENNNNLMTIAELRSNVTSKKGTTEQAIKVFIESDIKNIINKAELACYTRALELKQEFN